MGPSLLHESPYGPGPGRDFACNEMDKAIKDIKDTPKCINNGFCEDKGTGPEALTVNVDKVLKSFWKHGFIASAKKLAMDNTIEFGGAIIHGI